MKSRISCIPSQVHVKQETTFTTQENVWELGVEKEGDNPIVGPHKATLTVDGNKLVLNMTSNLIL
jgi:hypothetical protein